MLYSSGSKNSCTLRLATATIAIGTFSCLSYGNENIIDYAIEAGYEFNDNIRLMPETDIEISGGRIAIPASFTTKTERFTGILSGELAFSRYDEDEYDSDDQSFEGRGSYLFERAEVEGYANISRDTTRDSEFLDSGNIGLQAVRRETIGAGGNAKQLLSEQHGWQAELDYVNVEYDSPQYQNYKYVTAAFGWLYQYSERTALRIQAYGSQFENDEDTLLEVTSKGLGGQLGIENQLSEKLSLAVLAGWVSIDSNYHGSLDETVSLSDDSEDTHLLQASLKYKEQRYQVEAKLLSRPRPSSNGMLMTSDQVDLSYRYRLNEQARLQLGLTVGSRGIIDERIEADRDYARGKIRLDYRLSPTWFVSGSYTYSYQDRELAIDTADSNAIALTVTFNPSRAF